MKILNRYIGSYYTSWEALSKYPYCYYWAIWCKKYQPIEDEL